MLKAYVEFRVPQLFLDEVKAEQAEIQDNVVRVTQLRKRDHSNPRQVLVFVVATAIRQDLVLRLMAPAGALVGDDKKDKKIQQAADKLEADLARDLEDVCMDVRHGGYITAIAAEAA